MECKDRVAKAVQHFWKVRTQQHKKQGSAAGKKDAGNRSDVTGGKHLDGFLKLLTECRATGFHDPYQRHYTARIFPAD